MSVSLQTTGTLWWSVSEKKGGAASSPVDLCLAIGKNLFITRLVSRVWISYFKTEIHWAQGARAESAEEIFRCGWLEV